MQSYVRRNLVISCALLIVVVAVPVTLLLTRSDTNESDREQSEIRETGESVITESPTLNDAPAAGPNPGTSTVEADRAAPPFEINSTIGEAAVAVAAIPHGSQGQQDPGSVEGLNPESYPALQNALDQKTREPSSLTPMFLPQAFDREHYLQDPQSYLAHIKPGRVFQSAQPGPGVFQLKALGSRNRTVEAGKSLSLGVRTEPNMPVTYTSFDLGRFENRLTTITVQADGNGFAVARFTASPGTVGHVSVVAASPVASGQARFSLLVPRTDLTAAVEQN